MKSHYKYSFLLRLWQYLYHYKWRLLLAIILTLGSNILALVGPLLSGLAIDAITPGKDAVLFDKVIFYCGLMIFFYLVSSVLSYALALLMQSLSQHVSAHMRQDVFDKFSKLPVKYFDQHQTGDLISRITYDIDTINTSLSNDVIQILTSILTVLGSLIMMLIISPVLVTVFVITIPLSVYYTRYMAKQLRPRFKARSGKLGSLNGFVEEMISGQKVVKVYHQEETMITRFDEKNIDAVQAYYNADYYSSTVGPSINFINNISLSLVSVFGAILFLFNAISLGNLSSFVLYSRKFSGPINELANIMSELQSVSAAAERVFKLLDETEEVSDTSNAHEFSAVKGHVTFENITFGYDSNKPVIRKFSLDVSPGSLIAIVGPTGAGKTTLTNLLMRFYDPQEGCIKLDGINIKHATRKSLRSSFAMVLQDTWLFNASIYENIAYGRKNTTREEVIRVAKSAKIHGFIMQLPLGYDTILDESGINISQGQKQLLTIARAMLLNANLLILDEATSNVDTTTEKSIQLAMRELMYNKTCFVIAHRLSTIQEADHILVLHEGEIVEQGKHEDLLNRKGIYKDLYSAQFT
jgi:ATP-binding cassette subfamily B multidrug efflux pump